MIKYYNFVSRQEGCTPQQVIYIESEKEKLGLAACPGHGTYWVIPKEYLKGPVSEIRQKRIKPREVDEKLLLPLIEKAKRAPKEPGMGAATLDAIVVEEALALLNDPSKNN